METPILSIAADESSPEQDRRIIRVLNSGGIIVYPTDTFYGMGASGFSPAAIQKIYQIKLRDRKKPLSLVISNLDMLETIACDLPSIFPDLALKFWPGPLTVIVNASPILPDDLLGFRKTIGVRVPDHTWLQQLIHRAGYPLTATSANLSGGKDITDPAEAASLFSGQVDLIIDGGITRGGHPSTVLDLSVYPFRILREGAIPRSQLEDYLKG